MIRVCSSPIATSGWKLAGGVDVEVGQTTTVESARRSSAWTITAKRRPCWTRPRPRGSLISWTSPRTTKLFHQGCDPARFAHIGRIPHERRRLRSKAGAASFALGGLRDRLARRLRSADASTTSDLVERAQAVPAEPERQRGRWGGHAGNVAQNALRFGERGRPNSVRPAYLVAARCRPRFAGVRPVSQRSRVRGRDRGRRRAEAAVRDRVRPGRHTGSPAHGDLTDDAVGGDGHRRVEGSGGVGCLVMSQ